MRWIGIVFMVLIIFAGLSSCINKKQEVIVAPVCDTLSVSYSKTIVPILRDNCYSCHGGSQPSSNIHLDTYADIKNYAQMPGQLLMRMIRQKGASPMPLPPAKKLDDCQLNQIGAWINTGCPEN